MTSTALKVPIEIIDISDDELSNCLIHSPHSYPISDIETNSNNDKGHHDDLQRDIDQQKSVMSMKKAPLGNFIDISNGFHPEIVSRSDLANRESSNRTEVSSGVMENRDEGSTLSKYEKPVESFDVYISSVDGVSQLFEVVSYKAMITIDSSNEDNQPNSSSNMATFQSIPRNHPSNFETLAEDLEKGGRKTTHLASLRKKIVSAEECDTCSPPFHTCKQFSNLTANFTPNRMNIKPNKFAVMKPIDVYKCEVCSKAFTKEWACVRHQLIHEDPKTWNSCPFCTYKTPYISSLKIHLKNHKARRTTVKMKILRTRRIDSANAGKIRAKKRPFWQCIYCQKKFQFANHCEQHEHCCREGDWGKLSKVFVTRLRRGLGHSIPGSSNRKLTKN